MDIVALQVTRLPDSGSVRKKHFTFFWKGKRTDEIREHGIGFAMTNCLLSSIIPPSEGNERVMTLQVNTSSGPANLINVYASTLTSTSDAKDRFYDELHSFIDQFPQ